MVSKKVFKAYFCPKCNSVNVRYTFSMGNLFGVLPKMKCLDCGFTLLGNFPQVVKYPKSGSKKIVKKKVVKKKKMVKKNG